MQSAMSRMSIEKFKQGQWIEIPDGSKRIGALIQQCITQPGDNRLSVRGLGANEMLWYLRPLATQEIELHMLKDSEHNTI
jgi:hypothetical protein